MPLPDSTNKDEMLPQDINEEQMEPVDNAQEESQEAPGLDTSIDALLGTTNIAEQLDDEKLEEIGEAVHKGYMLDVNSKGKWDENIEEWIKLATQIKEDKTYPWPKASNVKYPILATSAMQFAARAYPSLVPADGKVVQAKVIGKDPQGLKQASAERVSAHMSYQLLHEMEDWEEDMDRLLVQLPIVGCLFKKTYYDEITKQNCSKLIGPKSLVVNYWATSLEAAERKTEIVTMNARVLQEQVAAGIYCDCDLSPAVANQSLIMNPNVQATDMPSTNDETTPYTLLEQHTFLDLDNDGIKEPYVITIEESSKKVLRIVARFDSDSPIRNTEGKLVGFTPVEYYTKFGFIPNPDGGFYDIGFGHLLGPLNDSANTLINLLIDGGTLSNLQAGFIGKGLRMKLGDSRFQPGEWKTVNSTGDDIKKQIFPMPTREPSDVLYKLLGTILESSKELASISEIFVGKMPGQNTPATTTMATIEQGMKLFTAIYKRVYRSLAKEFKKLYRLNGIYTANIKKGQQILDDVLSEQDYNLKSYDICPAADPTAVSSTQKSLKAESLMQLLQLGTIDPVEVTKRVLEAQEQPNIAALMKPQQPPPDPKLMAVQAKIQGDQQKGQQTAQLAAQKAQQEREKHQMEMEKQARALANEERQRAQEQQSQQFQQHMDNMARMMDQRFMALEKAMEARHKEQAHQQKMTHAAEAAKLKAKTPNGK